MMPRMRWSQLCFLGAEERNRALHGERQPVPINAYNIGADEHESHFGSSQNLFQIWYSKDSGMIPHLDVAVDRGRRARPVWRKAICGPYASRHSRGFHHTPQSPSRFDRIPKAIRGFRLSLATLTAEPA